MRNSLWFTWPGPLATDFPSGQQPYSNVWQGQPEYPGPSAGVKLSGQHLCWVATQPQPEQIKNCPKGFGQTVPIRGYA